MSTVSIRKTHGEDYASIKAVVDQVIADLGGLEDIIKPGFKVIIKPNLVACQWSARYRRRRRYPLGGLSGYL